MSSTPKAINVRELRENLSGYLHQAEQGAEFVITSRERVMARLVPPSPMAPRPFGLLKGKIKMADDFDELPADVIAAMEGDEEDR